jgi:folate-binding protein YgfZ|tara:strand:- start:5701 stop:6534 length:834 start_codon:yes stop_codon:yes gene_type:complete
VEQSSLINLEYLSILELNGKGSFELLQGQITSDMEKVSKDNCVLGSICDVKGRVIGSFITAINSKKVDSYHLIGDQKVLELIQNVLQKYQPFYDSKMSLEVGYKFYGIPADWLKENFPTANLDKTYESNDSFSRIHYLEKKFHIIYAQDLTVFDIYDISNDENEWKLDEIANFNYEVTYDSSNKFTPHELGYHLTSRVDFEKGCYTGQEIVARMHYRAKKLPNIIIQKADKEVKPLSKVYDENQKPIGLVLMSSSIEGENHYLLSMNKNYTDQKVIF